MKGIIFIRRLCLGHHTHHKIDFDKYFVERMYVYQDEILRE